MGKIKVRTLGNEEFENKQKNQAKQRAQDKKLVKGGKGGERVVSVGPSEEELANAEAQIISQKHRDSVVSADNSANSVIAKKQASKKYKKEKKSPRSKNYLAIAKTLDKSKKYSLPEALSMLEKLTRSKFDETVELHINTTETGVSGNIMLPHGTGKTVRVAIADDEVIAQVQKGKIDFDILLANPSMMPKLARVAKILGPKGLMPNPKNATLVKDPEKAAETFKKGQMNFKTETKAPIMHLTVGKISFGVKKLSENIESLIEAIKKEKIVNVTLKSTMSPGIKISL